MLFPMKVVTILPYPYIKDPLIVVIFMKHIVWWKCSCCWWSSWWSSWPCSITTDANQMWQGLNSCIFKFKIYFSSALFDAVEVLPAFNNKLLEIFSSKTTSHNGQTLCGIEKVVGAPKNWKFCTKDMLFLSKSLLSKVQSVFWYLA